MTAPEIMSAEALVDSIADGYGGVEFPYERWRATIERRDQAIIAKATAEERERCAKIAEAHKGAAEKKRASIPLAQRRLWPAEAHDEIRAEERGEDIAAEIIAAAIREPRP